MGTSQHFSIMIQLTLLSSNGTITSPTNRTQLVTRRQDSLLVQSLRLGFAHVVEVVETVPEESFVMSGKECSWHLCLH